MHGLPRAWTAPGARKVSFVAGGLHTELDTTRQNIVFSSNEFENDKAQSVHIHSCCQSRQLSGSPVHNCHLDAHPWLGQSPTTQGPLLDRVTVHTSLWHLWPSELGAQRL